MDYRDHHVKTMMAAEEIKSYNERKKLRQLTVHASNELNLHREYIPTDHLPLRKTKQKKKRFSKKHRS